MARAAPGSWSTMTRFLASKPLAPSEKQSLRNWGMVPEALLFQLGRYGVSLTLSRLSLVLCSTSSSHVLAGALMAACCSIGSLYLSPNGFVKRVAVGGPALDVLLSTADPLEWTLVCEVAREKLHGRISLSRRSQL